MLDLSVISELGKPGDIILSRSEGIIPNLICEGQRPLTVDHKPSLWSHVSLLASPTVIAESTIDFEPFEGYVKHPRKKRKEILPESPKFTDKVEEWRSRGDNGAQYNYLNTLSGSKRIMIIYMPLTDAERQKVMFRADEIIKEERYYNITGLVGALAAYWIFRRVGFNILKIPGTLFCSDFAQESFDRVHLDFAPGLSPGLTAPEHIYQYGLKQSYDMIGELE